MRKGQQTLLKKAEKHGFPEEYIKCLGREDLSLKRLECAYRIFLKYVDSGFDKEDIIRLAVYPCLNFYCDSIIYGLWKRGEKDSFPPARILDFLDDRRIGDGILKRNFTRLMIFTGAGTDEIISLYRKYAGKFREAEEIYYSMDGTQIWNTTAYRWFKIITGEYCDDGHVFSNFPLRKEYAETVLVDETLTCTAAEYAIRNNIPVEIFREYGYDKIKYLYHRIPYMELLPVDIRNHPNNYVSDTKIEKMELLEAVSDLLRTREDYINEPVGIQLNQIPSNTIKIKAAPSRFEIVLTHYKGVFYSSQKNEWQHTGKEQERFKTVLFLDGKVYEDRKIRGISRLVPLTVKRLCLVRNIFGEYGECVYEFLVKCSICMLNAPVMRDISRQIQKSGFFLPPVTINDCENIHNLNQLLRDKWKDGYRINWNKTDVNLGYMIVRSAAIVPEKDRAKIFEIRDTELVPDEIKKRMVYSREFGYLFLADYILGKVAGCSTDDKNAYRLRLRDYIKMCRERKTPVKTGFRSLKKIQDAHDKTAKAYNEKKNTHKVKIPKNSQFNRLRKLLPSDFEWIRSGKRLYEEGVMMGHCVNSYYGFINKDVSAIYSFVHKGKRYTAEFRVNKKGHYCIKQIQSKYDRGCPDDVWEMVKGLIEKQQK